MSRLAVELLPVTCGFWIGSTHLTLAAVVFDWTTPLVWALTVLATCLFAVNAATVRWVA